jgi:hypothetical protein
MAASLESQVKMYGMTVADIDLNITNFFSWEYNDDRPRGMLMYAMSMLSDSQEQLAQGRAEAARQTINRAKYVIANVRDVLRTEGK